MTLRQELTSWWSPHHAHLSKTVPSPGTQAPNPPLLSLSSSRTSILVFLRHCGCPWAEKSYLKLRDAALRNRDMDFIAVSHSDEGHTRRWLASLPPVVGQSKEGEEEQAGASADEDTSNNGRTEGGRKDTPSNLRVVVDEHLEAYGAYGLGVASWMHVVSAPALWAVYALSRDEGIANRPTESGSRWQMSGAFAVDANGVVRWGGPAWRADDTFDFDEAVRKVRQSGGESSKL